MKWIKDIWLLITGKAKIVRSGSPLPEKEPVAAKETNPTQSEDLQKVIIEVMKHPDTRKVALGVFAVICIIAAYNQLSNE